MRCVLLCLVCGALAMQAAKAQAKEPDKAAPPEPANPFAPVSWRAPAPVPSQPPVAPVAAVPPPAAPAPSAPPLPFKYLGRYTADVPVVVLMMGERMIVAKAGDTLDGGWRLDRLGPALIEFSYLPLQQKRSLDTGDAR